jgi:hypothetical protein
LAQVDDPRTAESLSVFYAHLARAQTEGDQEAIQYIRRAIAETMRPIPDGPIDMPLMTALRLRDRKRQRRARKLAS